MRYFILFSFLFISLNTVIADDLTGKVAPEFSGKNIDGQKINLSDYRGKIVLLDFWASWCIPCREEFPFLIEFYRKNQKSDFIVLAVNIDDKQENMHEFLNKYSGSNIFPVIFDKEKSIPPLYDLQSMPTSFFIDKKGIIRYVHAGFNKTDKNKFKENLSTLLHEQ